MVADPSTTSQKDTIRWTPHLIKKLRGTRTQEAFGALIGARKNTVWRWEAGQARPDARYRARLCELAAQERFLDDWQLVGSISLIGDLNSTQAELANLFRSSLN